MEINHFSHKHPLVLSEEKRSAWFRCAVCDECIFCLSYCCQICTYVIHKWCAELPLELTYTHGLHPQTLVLSHTKPSSGLTICKVCDLPIEQWFSYATTEECSSTKFHVECASFPVELLLRHELSYGGWKKYELCSVCQVKDNLPKLITPGFDKSYHHIHCAMLPRKVKHNVHLHELTLHPPLIEDDFYFQVICDACERDRDPASPVYYCEPCQFAAEIGCGVIGSEYLLIQDIIGTNGSEYLLIQDIIGTNPAYKIISSQFMQEEQEEEEEEEEFGEKDQIIEHFSHEHPLVLKSFKKFNMPSLDECSGCGQSICGWAYTCTEESCEWRCFYLHKWCAYLPDMIQCSVHTHHGPLQLMKSRLRKTTNQENLLVEDYSTFCEFCGMFIRPMCYGCEECDFQIHGLCALLPDNLNHQSHEHALAVVINGVTKYKEYDIPTHKLPLVSSETSLCQACGFFCKDVSLECKSCDFHIHVHCFFLPNTGKHTTHRHDLSLTYTYEEVPIALEYICDK